MRTGTPGRAGLVEAGKNTIISGDYAMIQRPRDWRAGDPVAVYCGGYSQGALNLLGWFMAPMLVAAGVAVVSDDLHDVPTTLAGSSAAGTGGPGTWGNDQTQTDLTAVYNFTQTSLGAASKILLMGGSQGAAPSLRWAAANPAKVAAVVLAIGAVDVEDIRANNRNSYQASIEAAFGLGAGVPIPSGKTGVGVASSLTVPVLDYYSDTDPIAVPATHTALAAANALIDSRNFGSVGHTLTGMPWATATAWALSYL